MAKIGIMIMIGMIMFAIITNHILKRKIEKIEKIIKINMEANEKK